MGLFFVNAYFIEQASSKQVLSATVRGLAPLLSSDQIMALRPTSAFPLKTQDFMVDFVGMTWPARWRYYEGYLLKLRQSEKRNSRQCPFKSPISSPLRLPT